MINPVARKIKQVIQQDMSGLETRFKQWTKLATSQQVIGTLANWKRSKRELIAENMFLRQQLIVLELQVSRPQMTQRDRQILVLLANRIKG
jgi:putative transposase